MKNIAKVHGMVVSRRYRKSFLLYFEKTNNKSD